MGFYYDQNENLYLELECGPAQSYFFLSLNTMELWTVKTPHSKTNSRAYFQSKTQKVKFIDDGTITVSEDLKYLTQ